LGGVGGRAGEKEWKGRRGGVGWWGGRREVYGWKEGDKTKGVVWGGGWGGVGGGGVAEMEYAAGDGGRGLRWEIDAREGVGVEGCRNCGEAVGVGGGVEGGRGKVGACSKGERECVGSGGL